MLTVDPRRRATCAEIVRHPWMTARGGKLWGRRGSAEPAAAGGGPVYRAATWLVGVGGADDEPAVGVPLPPRMKKQARFGGEHL